MRIKNGKITKIRSSTADFCNLAVLKYACTDLKTALTGEHSV